MRILPRTALGRGLGHDLAAASAWGLALAVVERIGRSFTSDLEDALALAALGALAFATAAWHRRRPVGWVEALVWLAGRARARIREWAVGFGVDLRETPPVPQGIPRWILGTLGILAALGAVLLPLRAFLPSGMREALSPVWYTGYLGLLAVLWAALAAGAFFAAVLSLGMIHDEFSRRRRAPRRGDARRSGRAAERAAHYGYLALLLAAGHLLPPAAALALAFAAGAMTVAALALPGNPPLSFLWRALPGRMLRSIDWRTLVGLQFGVLALLVCDLTLLSAGGRILPAAPVEGGCAPFTEALGHVFAWAWAGGCTILAMQVLRAVRLGRSRNPARAAPGTLHVSGSLAPLARRSLREAVARKGWQVRFAPLPARPMDVAVELAEEPRAASISARWPLRLSPADLAGRAIWERLARRDEIQRRRQIMRGLEKLFKRAAARSPAGGQGHWLGLQHWFMLGMSRDREEAEADLKEGSFFGTIVGEPFHVGFPREARHHWWRIARALQVDLLFVEDPVPFPKLERVVRVLLETYDVHGGRQRAEERHFSGLPGVRVMIHEFRLDDERISASPYPQPSYEDLGRARVLHVFKDRQEGWARDEVPQDASGVPLSGAR